ncbi:MAG: tetratricopeptide repeat protein, partial [Methylococcales bacterium]|nr:tetratricopeptide repeat protein [Methylococcales bacterium]
MSPSPHFIRGLQRNLLFLCNFAQDLEPSAIAELDTRHKNIIQAVEMGLTLPQTRLSAKKLIAAVFNHIFNRGYGGQWKPILARAGKHRDDEHTALQITLINQYGQLLCSSRRFDEALSSHTRAAELAQQCKDEYALAESWFRLSVTHRQKNELKRAYSLGLSALEILEGKPDGAQLLASVQHTLGLVVDNMGDTVSAEAFLRQSVTNWEQLNAPTELARAYS